MFTGRSFREGSVNPSGSRQPSHNLARKLDEKREELENLKELRTLSGEMAQSMELLQEKLETLTDGTEVIAAVMENWHNVLRAIQLASTKIPVPNQNLEEATSDPALPQTLVRIPVEDEDER